MPKQKASIGVIGGSGLYDLEGLKVVAKVRPRTPFGTPSDQIVIGKLGRHQVAFLPRHGRGHRLLPTEVPSRANIAALKSLGVDRIVSFSAVGSLKERLPPLDFVIPSQIIDRTRMRPNTFFGGGVVGHVPFADPFSNRMSDILYDKAREIGLSVHRDETLVCMEGPAFSTRAESHLYRSFKAGLINMSALPEAKLAREAEISYALVCMVTDYDCWRETDEDVDIQMVIENLDKNAASARKLLRAAIDDVAAFEEEPAIREAAKFAIITARDQLTRDALTRMRFLYPHYFSSRTGKVGKKKAAGRKQSAARKSTAKKAAARKSVKQKATKKKVVRKKNTKKVSARRRS